MAASAGNARRPPRNQPMAGQSAQTLCRKSFKGEKEKSLRNPNFRQAANFRNFEGSTKVFLAFGEKNEKREKKEREREKKRLY